MFRLREENLSLRSERDHLKMDREVRQLLAADYVSRQRMVIEEKEKALEQARQRIKGLQNQVAYYESSISAGEEAILELRHEWSMLRQEQDNVVHGRQSPLLARTMAQQPPSISCPTFLETMDRQGKRRRRRRQRGRRYRTKQVLESVVAERLSHAVETRGLLPTNHFGARKQRSAEQALMLLQESIYPAWRGRKILSLISFDVKGAYNGVCKERLQGR